MTTDDNILTIWYELGEIRYHMVKCNSNNIDIDLLQELLNNIKDQLNLIKMGQDIKLNPEDFQKYDELDLYKKSRKK